MIAKYKEIHCKTCGKPTISGKRNLCGVCYSKEIKAKEKEKRRRETVKKKVAKKRIDKESSVANLQVLYQRLIRLLTPDICSSCDFDFSLGRMKCGGHMIPKSRSKSVALLVSNIFSQCNSCNSTHIGNGMPIDLYKFGCKFWGESIMELTYQMSKISYSFNKSEREELLQYVNLQIDKAEKLSSLKDKEKLLRETYRDQIKQVWFKSIIDQVNNN